MLIKVCFVPSADLAKHGREKKECEEEAREMECLDQIPHAPVKGTVWSEKE